MRPIVGRVARVAPTREGRACECGVAFAWALTEKQLEAALMACNRARVGAVKVTPEEAGGDFDPLPDNLAGDDDFTEPNPVIVYGE